MTMPGVPWQQVQTSKEKTMLNPFKILPDKARLWIYLVVAVMFVGLTAWQASDGNVVAAMLTFLGTLQSLMSAANVKNGTPAYIYAPAFVEPDVEAPREPEATSWDPVVSDTAAQYRRAAAVRKPPTES